MPNQPRHNQNRNRDGNQRGGGQRQGGNRSGGYQGGGGGQGDQERIGGIPSPYYFVPLSPRVFEPAWAHQVSHDLPFRDSLSGEVTIELEAKRPIYVRGQAEKPQPPNPLLDRGYLQRFHQTSNTQPSEEEQAAFEAWTSFSMLGNKFAIPPTSIKGVVRSVLKLAAFGSFRDASSSDRYAVRDLNLPAYQQRFVEGNKFTPIRFKSKSGWLRVSGDDWFLHPCEHQRVEHEHLARATVEAKVRNPGIREISRGEFIATKDASNSVSAKYSLWQQAGMPASIQYNKGSLKNQGARHQKEDRNGNRYELKLHYAWATAIGSGVDVGRLVFTGQPSPQKHMEFIFDEPPHPEAPGWIRLNENVIQEFRFVHEDSESEGWDYWKQSLLRDGHPIPVFWLGSTASLDAIGLAQMFRLPAVRTLRDGIPAAHLAAGHDLADLIFGALQGDSLRGRASFSHFVAEESPCPMNVVWAVLGSPKPTFYPNYLEQEYEPNSGKLLEDYNPEKRRNETRPYRTLMSDKIQLRGWKRYAVRKDWTGGSDRVVPDHQNYTTNPPPSFDSATAFAPLPNGTSFVGKLNFHNLRPVELGALLWAIEWGGETGLRHLVGMGKGMGLGSVKMTIRDRDNVTFQKADQSGVVSVENVIAVFTDCMRVFCPNWDQSDPITELKLLANESVAVDSTRLDYPRLAIGQRNGNDFVNAKRESLVLRSYGEVTGRHARALWNPADAQAPLAVQIGVTTSLAEAIEIVEGRKGKIRGTGSDGMPHPIENLEEFSDQAVVGSKWNATSLIKQGQRWYRLKKQL